LLFRRLLRLTARYCRDTKLSGFRVRDVGVLATAGPGQNPCETIWVVEDRSLNVRVNYEGGMYWAQVTEWPGCFASGETLEELTEALEEAITLYTTPEDQEPGDVALHIEEMTLKVGAERPLTPAREPAPGPAPGPPRNRNPHAIWPLRGFHRRGEA